MFLIQDEGITYGDAPFIPAQEDAVPVHYLDFSDPVEAVADDAFAGVNALGINGVADKDAQGIRAEYPEVGGLDTEPTGEYRDIYAVPPGYITLRSRKRSTMLSPNPIIFMLFLSRICGPGPSRTRSAA
ncbi:hypothetical protein GCM10017707_08850 [Paenarthrobacter aurescens]